MNIYNGGSDKDALIPLSTTATAGNQLFISYTSNGVGMEFIASFSFGMNHLAKSNFLNRIYDVFRKTDQKHP